MNRLHGFTSCFGVIAAASLLSACSQKTEPAATPPPVAEVAPPAPAPAAEAAPPAALIKLEVTDASGAQLSGDPVAGREIFKQCETCHSSDAGKNMIGPSLHGVINRPAGTVAGFKYSNANKNSGITWSEQEIYTYLENPKKRVPGTLMTFPGLKDSQERANVIAYLTTKTGVSPVDPSSANCLRMAAAMSDFADGCARMARRSEALDVAEQWLDFARMIETADDASQSILRLRALVIATRTSAALRQPLICDVSGVGLCQPLASQDS